MNVIPVLKPHYDEETIEAVAEVLRSGWVGLGPKTKEFEDNFSEYIGCNYTIGCNSCTSALHLALLSLQLEPGDEVMVPPITFVSTVHIVKHCGLTPVFVDVESKTLNMDPFDIEHKITDRTKAIIPVHFAGNPCKMKYIDMISKKRGITVIEDAAHACGAEYNRNKIGNISDLTCFSFHAVKNLAMGEGGAITTNSDFYDKWFREMRWLGISKDTYTRNENVYSWRYWVDKLGYKYHLSDIAAAIGIVQLKKLDENNKKRKEIVEKYKSSFNGLPIEFLKENINGKSSNHLFVIKLYNSKTRDRMIAHLKKNKISSGVHYYPINLHPYYRNVRAEVPIANMIWERMITLPLYPSLTEEEQNRVIDAVRSFEF
ncbi:MAG: DegT/DnrJ/EryC1/StrS family aminotransferase [Atribacterota bacterium]